MMLMQRIMRFLISGMAWICNKLIHKLDKNTGDAYEVICSGATYAPWTTNPEFQAIYKYIAPFTLVDIYRCYELWELAIQTSKCIEGDIIEVGVYKGETGTLLTAAANSFSLTSAKPEVFLCDTFSGVVKVSAKDAHYHGGEHKDTSAELVEKNLKGLNLKNYHLIAGIFPEDFPEIYAKRKFRFAHIDVDAYQSGKEVFEFIWPRVVAGGVVVFDDYGFVTTGGITDLLNEIKSNVLDGTFIANINGHGIFVKNSTHYSG